MSPSPDTSFAQGRNPSRWFGPAVFHENLGPRPSRFKKWFYAGRHERSRITFLGWCFIFLTFGIGSAAYNSANNLLFIALALLFASFILSGVLSWINFRVIAWRLLTPTAGRAGEPSSAEVELRSFQTAIPSVSLFCEMEISHEPGNVRRLALTSALMPGASRLVNFPFTPTQRGRLRVKLVAVGSLFPFGFLRKALLAEATNEILIRPARLVLDTPLSSILSSDTGTNFSQAPGSTGDLRQLRDYQRGDNPRSIHWKTSARAGRLLVREQTREVANRLSVRLSTHHQEWSSNPQLFEKLCSLAATLAEDLFLSDRLLSTQIDDQAPLPLRHPHDLEVFLSSLATLEPKSFSPLEATVIEPNENSHTITFRPHSATEVAAYLHGKPLLIA